MKTKYIIIALILITTTVFTNCNKIYNNNFEGEDGPLDLGLDVILPSAFNNMHIDGWWGDGQPVDLMTDGSSELITRMLYQTDG